MNTSLACLVCGVGIVVLRIGLSIYAAGAVRAKNAAACTMRGLLDISLAILAFWTVGRFVAGIQYPSQQSFLLICASLLPSGIAAGAVAERSRLFPISALPILLAGLITPLAWRWNAGWLHQIGFHDLAGASIFHLSGAACALASALLVGPRTGKFNRDGSSNAIPGHSIPLASAGVLLLFLGWPLYVAAFLTNPDRAADVATSVLLAAAAGAVVAMLLSQVKYLKPDIHLTSVGLLSSLVAISAAADLATGWTALLIGAVAGFAAPLATVWIDLVARVDDPTAAVGIHGVGAICGLLAAAFLAPADTLSARLILLGTQLLGLLAIGALSLALSFPLLWSLKKTVGLRSNDADEYDGLDLAEHDIGAYPDFQQTMIKSYHLREA